MSAATSVGAPYVICILGAESTGKTTLAQSLAQHFDCPWVGEYLREFCDTQARTPTREEQALVLDRQHAAELSAVAQAERQRSRFVFCDTAPLLTAIYSEFIFADLSHYAQARKLHSHYALTLLLAPDIGWTPDGLQREGEWVRAPVTQMIKRELAAIAAPFANIHGQGEQRLAAALAALRQLDPDLETGRVL